MELRRHKYRTVLKYNLVRYLFLWTMARSTTTPLEHPRCVSRRTAIQAGSIGLLALGIPSTAVWQDEFNRPHPIYHGDPIDGLT